jgi:hypothetical protein
MCAADYRLPLRRNMAKTIAGYVAKGLKVVKVYRPVAVKVCSCSEGARCSKPGKHPIGGQWAVNAATTSEQTVMEWWGDDHTAPNVGVILGPVYGVPGKAVIDVEPDTEEGIEVIRSLGLERYDTPTYESGKSPHQLYSWEPGLPETGAFTFHGVEVRLGNTGMEQSVMPPSVHPGGRLYRWRDGFGLEDVDIAPLPDALRQWIMDAWAARSREDGSGGRGGRSLEILRRKHLHANRERHKPLMSFAGFLARAVNVGDAEEEGLFLDVLHAVNARQVVPPNPDDEVNDIWRYALKYRRQDLVEATICEGVSMVTDGGPQRFVPDGLELTIVKSDPPSYRLSCESWKKFNKTGFAILSAEDFMSAKKAAVALAAQVGGLRLDRWPGDWVRIWDGKAGRPATKQKDGEEPVVGLRTLLVDEAVAAGRIEEVVDPARHRLRRLAAHLYTTLSRHARYQNDDRRSERDDWDLFNRGAQWVRSSSMEGAPLELWFAWHTIWADVERLYRVEPNEGARLVAAMPEIIGRKLVARKKQINGQRSSFRTLSQDEWGRLEAFAIGECEEGASISQNVLPVECDSEDEESGGTLVRGDKNEVCCL